ncbi:MAG: hypothetical protein IKA55_02330 [Akkermansia sp.]|nr:hypothetical protein [Akkermansia sp.]
MKTKTNKLINLLATSIIGLTLCACGGGGGGGGGGGSETDGSNSEHPSTEQTLAPVSLSSGDTFIISSSDTESLKLKIQTQTWLYVDDTYNMSYRYEYISANSARLYVTVEGEEGYFSLNFTSPNGGYVGDDYSAPFTFTRANTGNSANGGTSSGSSTVSGYAPQSLDGYYIAFNSTVNGIQKIGFSGNTVTISPANVSGTYSYTRSGSNGNEGSVTLNCSGSNYDSNGAMTLTFHSASSVTLKGKINSNTYTLTGSFAKGKVQISGGSSGGSTATGTAPSSMSGMEIRSSTTGEFLRFVNGSKVEQGQLGTTTAWGSGTYTYSKTSNTTGILTYNITGNNGNWTERSNMYLDFSTQGSVKITGFVEYQNQTKEINRTDTLVTATGR